MSESIEVRVIVEGPSERTFFRDLLAPYLSEKGIILNAQIATKPGTKGGDIKFERVICDIGNTLRQRKNIYVSTFLDYYGINTDWPGLSDVRNRLNSGQRLTSRQIGESLAQSFEKAFQEKFEGAFEGQHKRFIPFLMVHEFEALLFSDGRILREELNSDPNLTKTLKPRDISDLLKKYDDCPEMINNNKSTAPSKRLEAFYPNKNAYKKVIMGKKIGSAIGIKKMREKCPHFNAWLEGLEKLECIQ